MKDIKFPLLLGGLSMLFSGCSQDALYPSGSTSEIVFHTIIPEEIASRAFGEGSKVTTLTYAVYEKGTTERLILSDDNVSISSGMATLSLSLTKGKSYEVIFWADCRAKGIYEFDSETKTISIDYENAQANDDERDAFFGSANLTVNGESTETIELYRPFAQINIGTSDIETAKVDKTQLTSSMSLQAYSKLNLSTGEVSNPVEVDFSATATPGLTETYPGGEEYYYLEMNYLLVDKEKSILPLKFTIAEDKTVLIDNRELINIPLQRNYRTNISGSLLTDATKFVVTLSPTFGGSNGETPENPNQEAQARKPLTTTENGKEIFLLGQKEELYWIAQNSESIDWEKSQLRLTNDIDLEGEAWSPINITAITPEPVIIDGAGYSVSNYTFDESVGDKGLFGTLENAEIHDLTVKNVEYTASTTSENMGAIAGSLNGSIDNITVSNISLKGAQNVGAVAGKISGGTSSFEQSTVSYTEVTGCTISATEAAGGIAGVFENTTALMRNAEGVFLINGAAIFETTLSSDKSDMTGILAGRVSTSARDTNIGVAEIYCDDNSRYLGGNASYEDIKMDTYRQEGTIIYVENIDQLRKAIEKATSGTTIRLTRNLNFYKKIIDPIVVGEISDVTIDGGNFTISNFRLSEEKVNSGSAFFIDTNKNNETVNHTNLKICNLRFINIDLNGSVQGIVINRLKGMMENVTIEKCTISSTKTSVGMACGRMLSGEMRSVNISNCTLRSTAEVGGMIGCAGLLILNNPTTSNNNPILIIDCSLNNITAIAEYSNEGLGAIVGRIYNQNYVRFTNLTTNNSNPKENVGMNNGSLLQ